MTTRLRLAITLLLAAQPALAQSTLRDRYWMAVGDPAGSCVTDRDGIWVNYTTGQRWICETGTWQAKVLSIDAANITSGTVNPARLGSGSGITTKFLRGDSTWQTVSGGAPAWGDITGTLSAQTDLQTALDGKEAAGTFSGVGTCTNQFARALNDGAAPTCATVSLTADVTNILPGANGGSGNGFFAVSGPAASLKTFTLPNASATILTSNAAVTVPQGGTGAAPGADDQLLVSDSSSAATWRALTDCQGAGKAVTYTASSNTWGCNTISGSDPWTYLTVNGGSDFTTSSATAVDVTGLSFTPSANTKYEFECKLALRTATTTVNPRIGFAWSTGLTDGVAWLSESQAATGAALQASGNPNAALLVAVGGLPNTTQSWPALVQATIVAGASPSGTTRVQIASETAGTNVTVRTVGSTCKYRSY